MAHHDKTEANESPPLPRLSYKIKEVARILGVSPITVRRAALLVGPFRDMRYPQFAVVARPRAAAARP